MAQGMSGRRAYGRLCKGPEAGLARQVPATAKRPAWLEWCEKGEVGKRGEEERGEERGRGVEVDRRYKVLWAMQGLGFCP